MTTNCLPDTPKIAFLYGTYPEAKLAYKRLIDKIAHVPVHEADVIVALGGDGWLLQVLHESLNGTIPIYGMHRGSIGFLMNEYNEHNLIERLHSAQRTIINPLLMNATDEHGVVHTAYAFNEVSLLRASAQAAKIAISVNEELKLDELVCDGILVATPAGSTAYNFSAHGPIMPINSQMLALTPICAFRPRRWRGALLANTATVQLEILKHNRRPVNIACDNKEFQNITHVTVSLDKNAHCTLLFDEGHSLEERILHEQFLY